jgi:lysophospholipase L1-like esterase
MKISSAAFLLVSIGFATAQPQSPFEKWDKEISSIEQRLKAAPPSKGGVFFVGSSSIRLWKLDKAFPGATNVGFGGSQIRDSAHFASRIILPYEPSVIVFYAGDNDIASKRTPNQVLEDFREFAKKIHDASPKTRILFLAIKPSVKRWEMHDQQLSANALVKEFCAKDSRLVYLDTVTIMLDSDGKPMPDLFVKDGLHLSDKGYALWNELVRKHMK